MATNGNGCLWIREQTITYEDYMAGRLFEDAVCHSLYFIDVHTEGAWSSSLWLRGGCRPFPWGR